MLISVLAATLAALALLATLALLTLLAVLRLLLAALALLGTLPLLALALLLARLLPVLALLLPLLISVLAALPVLAILTAVSHPLQLLAHFFHARQRFFRLIARRRPSCRRPAGPWPIPRCAIGRAVCSALRSPALRAAPHTGPSRYEFHWR